ncbi:glycine-rich domain-containing protein [Catenuloplanes sp. NPDC051500]|uniref:glycine-rich domain-containing protein n=1 Tax=Catenuloplanes sp. NPDC051500 TaxID=3363959 RepID=UPI00378DF066
MTPTTAPNDHRTNPSATVGADCWPEETPNPAARTGSSLIDLALFTTLTTRIAADHPDLSDDMPARILDQALAFLGACAVTTTPIGPSDLVDIGWHTLILHTEIYTDLCHRIAGRFIHHIPDDPADTGTSAPLTTTTAAITAAGYRIDLPLWTSSGTAKCTQCHAGCTDSPTR